MDNLFSDDMLCDCMFFFFYSELKIILTELFSTVIVVVGEKCDPAKHSVFSP